MSGHGSVILNPVVKMGFVDQFHQNFKKTPCLPLSV